jgi:hypothetical protein
VATRIFGDAIHELLTSRGITRPAAFDEGLELSSLVKQAGGDGLLTAQISISTDDPLVLRLLLGIRSPPPRYGTAEQNQIRRSLDVLGLGRSFDKLCERDLFPKNIWVAAKFGRNATGAALYLRQPELPTFDLIGTAKSLGWLPLQVDRSFADQYRLCLQNGFLEGIGHSILSGKPIATSWYVRFRSTSRALRSPASYARAATLDTAPWLKTWLGLIKRRNRILGTGMSLDLSSSGELLDRKVETWTVPSFDWDDIDRLEAVTGIDMRSIRELARTLSDVGLLTRAQPPRVISVRVKEATPSAIVSYFQLARQQSTP